MMVEKGTKFTFNGNLAKALEYMPSVGLWFCVYEEDEWYFYLFPEEIEKSRKEADKDMKVEYKFYEKNLAPKWLEGDYDLHIEGNRMTMTSKDGKKVEARCHPEDDWRLQVGIDELKERMAEAKKPREIKVGDKVRLRYNLVPNVVYTVKYIDKELKVAMIYSEKYELASVYSISKLELVN